MSGSRKRKWHTTTGQLLKEATAAAYAKHKLPQPKEQAKNLPLIPVSVSVDIPKTDHEVREVRAPVRALALSRDVCLARSPAQLRLCRLTDPLSVCLRRARSICCTN